MAGVRIVALAGLAAAALVLAAVWVTSQWASFGPASAQTVQVTIAPGASLRSAATSLKAAGAIDNSGNFVILARILADDKPVQAGTYAVPKALGYGAIMAMLQNGRVVAARITIPEGMPSILVAERLRANPDLTGTVVTPAEGSILPDTYSFAVGSTRQAASDHMQMAMRTALAKLWVARKATIVVKSPEQAIILASIVEKETGKASERRMVAGVYSNRLRIGMKLDADPTVIYPITKGKSLGRRIKRSELHADNGYNTYARAGLPNGPIANPGAASIAAVLDPAATQALFFVADGSGGHVFANSLAQHNANVAKWFALRRARGEM